MVEPARPRAALPHTAPLNAAAAAAQSIAIWVNGERVDADARHVSARDRGLTLADGLFETMRAHEGVIFRLDQHLDRLRRGLAVIGIPEPSLRDWLPQAVATVSAASASVRVTVTRGVGDGLAPPHDVRPTVIVAVAPFPTFAPAVYERGLTASIASGRRNERAMTAGLKTLAYLDSVTALVEARQQNHDEALFLDTDAHLSEASASNLFMRIGETLITPPLSCGALPGITRAVVIELAPRLGFSVSERPCAVEELLRADEAFLTSSLRGVAPLVRVGATALGDGTPGPATGQVRAAYRELVSKECGGVHP